MRIRVWLTLSAVNLCVLGAWGIPAFGTVDTRKMWFSVCVLVASVAIVAVAKFTTTLVKLASAAISALYVLRAITLVIALADTYPSGQRVAAALSSVTLGVATHYVGRHFIVWMTTKEV